MGLTVLNKIKESAAQLQGGIQFLAFSSFWKPLTLLDVWPLVHLQSQPWLVESFPHCIADACLPLPFLRTLVTTLGPSGSSRINSLF